MSWMKEKIYNLLNKYKHFKHFKHHQKCLEMIDIDKSVICYRGK